MTDKHPSWLDRMVSQSGLTHSQIQIWTGQKLAPESPLYNMALLFFIDGAIEQTAFAQAWQQAVDASDAMRTYVEDRQGLGFRRIREPGASPLQHIDLSSAADPQTAFRDWASRRCAQPLPLDGELVDSVLCKLTNERYGWYLNHHHLITDATSVRLLYGQVAALYARLTKDQDAPVPSFRPYYATADALRDFLPAKARDPAIAHWRERLDRVDRTTPFYGRAHTPATTRNQRHILHIDGSETARLKALGNEPGFLSFTPSISMFSVFSTLTLAWLHRLSGKRELGFDAPAMNRPTPDAKDALGLFIEVFPFAADVEADATFRSLGERCLAETQSFLRHALPGTSSPARSTVGNVVLNFFSGSYGDFADFPATVEWIHPGHADSVHAARVQVCQFDEAGGYTLYFDFNEASFSPKQQQDAIEVFGRLLKAFCDDPDSAIAAVPVLTETEHKEQFVDFNADAGTALPSRSVIALFDAQAERTPDAMALRCRGDRLTYKQLQDRTHAVAAALAEHGVGPGTPVAVYMRRSIATVVAILGVLKARGIYVPVDPANPPDRVRLVLKDSGVGLILTSQADAAPLTDPPAPVFDIDQLVDYSAPAPTTHPALDDLAYMIYTSGSTGTPKGVPISHGGLADYLEWAQRQYLRGDRLDMPLFTSLSFDLTVTSLYLPLISGGTLVIYPEPDGPIDSALMDVISENAVDLIKLTPSHLSLLKQLDLSTSRLQRMVVGGEDLKAHLAAAISGRFGGQIEIYNEYGPTEAVVGCMIHRYDPAVDTAPSVPIGRPADHVQLYVLNQALMPVPTGVPGELCIARYGLAPGYHRRPELTAEKFVPHPFKTAGMLYRTGDLVRFADTQTLEYLGRIDRQVKISGFRVEPGEIEAALLLHPDVQACVITPYAAPTAVQKGEDLAFCTRCGLPSNYPGATFDAAGVCTICRSYEAVKDQAQAYFKDIDALQAVFADPTFKPTSEYDCMMLLSGGKDSTYALCRLVDMGLKVYAFSLDNGYISDQAKDNIRRVTENLGVEFEFGTTPAMNAIFRDSLTRFSNVCNGCFKTIYTLSVNRARQLGINTIVTGLSRGQMFETRLTENIFRDGRGRPDEVDEAVLAARKAYHRLDDEVSRSLDVAAFRDDRLFGELRFVDFYRYCDVGLDEVLAYLDRRVPWIRPSDTGRSTNCLINDVGIHIHKKERGYHNYALPYSWDVRMGHKTRDEAIAELHDAPAMADIRKILKEIDYDEDRLSSAEGRMGLALYYVAGDDVKQEDLRRHLSDRLPAQLVPQYLTRLDAIPLTSSGKTDLAALPLPALDADAAQTTFVAPQGDTQERVAAIWQDVLGLKHVGARHGFFELGGTSLAAMEIMARVCSAFDTDLPLQTLFKCTTVEALATAVDDRVAAAGKRLDDDTIESVPRSGTLQASLGQQGVFVAHQANPDSPNLNITSSFRVRGDLDPARLERCIGQVVGRHEILRTSYRLSGDAVQLIVHEGLSVPLDSRECADPETMLSTADELVRCPFDLAQPPLLRMHYLYTSQGDGLLVLVCHHIVFDEWSLRVFWKEVATLYSQQNPADLSALAALPVQFADVAAWQRKLLIEGRLDEQFAYWQTHLAAPPEPLALPTDRAYPPHVTYVGRLERWHLSATLTQKLKALAADAEAPLSSVLLLGFQILLQRYTGSNDILVASPIANRRTQETMDLIGFMLNTVALRARLEGDPLVRAALQKTHDTLLEAIEHQDIPYVTVIEKTKPPRVAGRHALCQTMFVYQREDEAAPELALGDALLEHTYIETRTAKFDITLFATESGDGMETILEYRTDIFEPETMHRMLRHYEYLLESLASAPDSRLSQLDYLAPDERTQLLVDFQGERLGPDRGPGIVAQISAQAIAAPTAPAVITSNGSLTYGQLVAQSQDVAAQLQSQGVGPGQRVAHMTDRSAASVSGLVGILAAGGAYVPLDPEYPEERRLFVLQDADIIAGVTTPALRPFLASLPNGPVVLDDRPPSTSGNGVPLADPAPDQPAYLIYTSGSTGKPKGVTVSHDNLRHSTYARCCYYDSPPARFLLIPSYAFDSSVAGLFWTLTQGGALVVADAEEQRDPQRLDALMRRHQVSDLLCIPALYRELLTLCEHASESAWPDLKRVIVAGEECPSDLVELHLRLLPEVELHNEYGPTEATVWATAHRCSAADTAGPVPIGRPIPGTQVYLLDTDRRPVAVGIPGELYIGGPGVAGGYLNRPDLTAERFVASPFAPRQRLYRSGDMARWSADGRLHFVGRADDQVKIRGYRIELGEVEAVLRAHPDLVDAAVATNGGATGPQRLLAYAVPRPQAARPTPEALRRHLEGVLPRYAVPAAVVLMDRLPRLPNGKLDRASLPKETTPQRPKTQSLAASTPTEKLLLDIWQDVLGIQDISLDDNFFSLGGDSFMSIQIVSRARGVGLQLAPHDLVECPTLGDLANRLAKAADDVPQTDFKCLVPIQTRGRKPRLFCVHTARAIYYRHLANHLGQDYPLYALQPIGINGERPLKTVETIAASYLEEIRALQPSGPYHLLSYCLGASVAFEMAQQLRAAGERVDLLAIVDSSAPNKFTKLPKGQLAEPANHWQRFYADICFPLWRRIKSFIPIRRHRLKLMFGSEQEKRETLFYHMREVFTMAHARYTPKEYPGPMLFIHCEGSLEWKRHYWQWEEGFIEDWQKIAPYTEAIPVPCHHEDVLVDPEVRHLAQILRERLTVNEVARAV